ncbi:hypothetical protein [Maribellus maritimus]|uniref:hypothetical protein n=1 Tax=Maribellus maritimus TaxID=2870838 RepID=UPI001EEC004F|nr:hypothetical protein [Maribellus maritimus]MCG6190662.1 hypothetical protein [Maribellus maritimus]
MKTKIIISLSLIVATALMMSCTDQPYYDIPYDENGNVYITEISEVTSDGVTTADDSFTINCYFPNAKSGDTMVSTVLKRQVPSWDPGGAEQLLPLAGTEKSITVGSDFKTSVTYTRTEAQLMEAGDAITVVFSGATDSGIIEITLRQASE